MADLKDSTMKLFGKTFSLRRSEEASSNEEQSASISVVDSEAGGESCSDRKVLVSSSDNTACALPDESLDEENKENSAKDPNSDYKESSSQKSSKSEVISDSSPDNNKTLKKPEKIVPCPRCNSMETKFCYFNNYNVNQPRHFCKNCQRYWTAGGTMRNVPVGAGRRKNKNSAAAAANHYRQLIIPESLQSHPGILTFGSSETPLVDCENQSSSSSVTASNSSDHQAPACFPGPPPPWPYWAAPQGFCHSGYPVSFYPAGPFWAPVPAGPWTPQQEPGVLGKRSRVEGEVLIPKTLRIDDPAEAAKSSIWATLGIRNEKTGSSGLFEPFQSKSKASGEVVEMSPAMHANPAAMSRSLRFLESV